MRLNGNRRQELERRCKGILRNDLGVYEGVNFANGHGQMEMVITQKRLHLSWIESQESKAKELKFSFNRNLQYRSRKELLALIFVF